MRLQDLAIVTNTQLDVNPTLLERFKAHDRVVWDVKTDLYSYKVCATCQASAKCHTHRVIARLLVQE